MVEEAGPVHSVGRSVVGGRVAVTTGRTPIIPSTAQGRSTTRRTRRGRPGWVDHAVHLLDALVAEVGHGDRGIGHLGAPQPPGAGALDEVAKRAMSSSRVMRVGVVDGGGDEAAAAERDGDPEVHGAAGWNPPSQKPLSPVERRAAVASP